MKIFEGVVVSTGMKNTVIVQVTRQVAHPLYKKLLKRSKRYKVETKGIAVNAGDLVKIVEVKPISKDKHFILKQALTQVKESGKSVVTEAKKEEVSSKEVKQPRKTRKQKEEKKK